MDDKILELLRKGYDNPSAIASILYTHKMGGGLRFMELRKHIEYIIQKERSKQ